MQESNIDNLSSDHAKKGLVLASYHYKESDLILQILFEEIGKISVIARGARKSKQRFFGGVEIFEFGLFQISKGKRGKYLQLDGVSQRIPMSGLRTNLFSYQAASLLLEIASKLINDEDPEGSKLLEPVSSKLRFFASHPNKLEGKSVLGFGILQICKHAGIDPSNSHSTFRSDDLDWFGLMLKENKARTYEPEEAINRALSMLLLFIETNMGIKIKSELPV